MNIRKADLTDIDAIANIYSKVHTAEEKGELTIGWQRGIYPERITAQAGVERGDIFVMEDNGRILGSAILNKQQVDVYSTGSWQYEADDESIMVMHTLVIDPEEKGKGYGRSFVKFYEQYALENGCPFLRMDTNERNTAARSLYKKLGYAEIGIVPCVFNGLKDVNLVLLEKKLS